MCYIVLYQEQNKIIFFIEMFASWQDKIDI
jgi:hypothetical protein